MIVDIVTLFPDMFDPVLRIGMTGRALEKGILQCHCTNPREFAVDARGSVDDLPYGGGSGMILRPEPVVAALETIENRRGRGKRILFTPAGAPLQQTTVRRLATEEHLVLLCGRYEGIDERVAAYVDEEVSLGDFVLTGGELPAMALIDAITRLLPGVLHDMASTQDESFEEHLLEYPQYTRPPSFRGAVVPDVLLSGHHEKIKTWRRAQSIFRTQSRRPDLFALHNEKEKK